MAENLPSYEEATSRDAWKIITPHLQPSELKAVSLACKSIAEYTTQLLWPQPALHFGQDDDVILGQSCRAFVVRTTSLRRLQYHSVCF